MPGCAADTRSGHTLRSRLLWLAFLATVACMDLTQTLTQTMKDTAYVAVGMGVLGFQRAQVARVELGKTLAADSGKLQAQVKAQVGDVSGAVEAQLSEVKTQLSKVVSNLEPVAKELEVRLDEVEERLPEQVKTVVATARQAAEAAATQVRSLLAA